MTIETLPLYKLGFLFLAILLLYSCQLNSSHHRRVKNEDISIIKIIDSLNYSKNKLTLLIDKSDYSLFVLSGKDVVKEYEVVFGNDPINDKLMEGDRRTPEGTFKVRDFYPHKSWSKFIWINYPTEESWKKHKAAKASNLIDQKATIGGEIGIHGTPLGKEHLISSKTNWTWGCISMTNEDVNDLYQIIHNNMIIKIQK